MTSLLRGEPAHVALVAANREIATRRAAPVIHSYLGGGDRVVHANHLQLESHFARDVNEVRQKANDLLVALRPQEAYDYLSDVRKTKPNEVSFILDFALQSELLSGHYQEAFQDAVGLVNAREGNGEEQYLYLSLASSAQGRVYPGQARYCESWVESHLKSEHSPLDLVPTPMEMDPREVMLLSCLALGTKSSPEFLELALQIDPSSDLAAREAISYYGFTGRYSEIRRIALSMVEHLAPGESRNYFVNQMSAVSGLKDKPLHPIIKP